LPAALALGFALAVFGAAGDGQWLTRVPPKEKTRPNPFAGNPQAIAAGEKLFERHCSACHGATGEGLGVRPALHTERVRQATAGELHWLLTNGSLKNGMPSWSHLPDAQRWQIVSFLKK
jgi:cytochrome c oxidase cbb3-type subunit 2